MNIPIQNITYMTPSQIITLAHKTVGIPAIILTFLTFVIFLILFGFILIRKGKGKYFLVVGLAAFFTLIFSIIIILCPLLVQSIADFFIKLFS